MSETDWADKSQAQAGDSEDSGTDAASSQDTTAGDSSAEADLRAEAPEPAAEPVEQAEAVEEPAAETAAEAAQEPAAEPVAETEAAQEPAAESVEQAEAAKEPAAETAAEAAEEPAAEPVEQAEAAEEPAAEPVAEAVEEPAAETVAETEAAEEPAAETVEQTEAAEEPAAEPVAETEAAQEPAAETVGDTPSTDEPASTEAAGEGEPAEEAQPPRPPDNPNHKWYILQTYSGFEHRVEKTVFEKLKVEKLEDLVSEIFVPGEDVERVKNGKKRKIHVIYYPGYVLIKMELKDELWHLLMDIPRVSGFVGGTNREPRPLPEEELGAIRSQMNQGVQEAVMRDEFEVGQQVIVIDGPFANFSGKIDEVNTEKNKLRVLISILGRSTPVELDFDKVKDHPDPA